MAAPAVMPAPYQLHHEVTEWLEQQQKVSVSMFNVQKLGSFRIFFKKSINIQNLNDQIQVIEDKLEESVNYIYGQIKITKWSIRWLFL